MLFGPPIETFKGEPILLRGGFGGAFGIILLLSLVGLVPFLRSGTYLLTDRRLIWTPRFGKEKEVPLSKIPADGIKVSPFFSTMKIKTTEGEVVALRHIRGLERLWGAILLFKRERFAEGAREPAAPVDDLLVMKAWKVDGLKTQKGYVAIQPALILFLPSERASHLLKEAGRALGWAALGVHEIRLQAKLPLDLWVEWLRRQRPQEFRERLTRTAEAIGGLCWRPDEGKPLVKAIPFRPNRKALWFNVHGSSIRIAGMEANRLRQAARLLGMTLPTA